jgi:AraC family transcriptional regulator of adaptative response/methylated-DNA-[protein]-cysteine methyltransferase
MPSLPSVAEMERAYRERDASYDGVFFLGVRTTGVFCRPSCGARKPQPKNVQYFATPREALFAGYRPCKRCRPLASPGTPPAWVEKILAEVERDPTRRFADADVRRMGVDPVRIRRFFQTSYGMTFQSYCRSRRLGRALDQIRQGTKLDDVLLGVGYESHSGFREAFVRTFGRSPGKANGEETVSVTWIESPLGPLVAASLDARVVLLEFTDRRMLEEQFRTLRRHFKRTIIPGETPVLEQLRRELGEYFRGTRKLFSVPLESPGSDFQRRVWRELQRIPFGRTLSYEELARRVGSPGAQRAVGTANGRNRIAIVIPCHRVVNKDGELGGYGGGLWRKHALLDLERGMRRYEVPEHPDRRNSLQRIQLSSPHVAD